MNNLQDVKVPPEVVKSVVDASDAIRKMFGFIIGRYETAAEAFSDENKSS